jgi:hypothetical protein
VLLANGVVFGERLRWAKGRPRLAAIGIIA